MNMRIVRVALAVLLGLLAFGVRTAAAVPIVGVPSIDANLKEEKVRVTGNPFLLTYRTNERGPCSLDWSARLKNRDKKAGRVDVTQLSKEVREVEVRNALEYAQWLQTQDVIGPGTAAIGQFVSIVDGMEAIVCPGLGELRNVKRMVISVDGGFGWNVAVPIPDVGWGAPFSRDQLKPGLHHMLVATVDKSNSREIKIFVITIAKRKGEGTQWTTYQFAVLESQFEDGERIDVAGLTRGELRALCTGIMSPFPVRPQSMPQTTRVDGGNDKQVERRGVEAEANDRDRQSRRQEATSRVEVTVRIKDADGRLKRDSVSGTAYSFDGEGHEIDRVKIREIQGSTVIEIKSGETYRVDLDAPGFTQVEAEADENGATFVFQEEKVQRRERSDPDRREERPRRNSRDDGFRRDGPEGRNRDDDRQDRRRNAREERPDTQREVDRTEMVEYTICVSQEELRKAHNEGCTLLLSWWADGHGVSIDLTDRHSTALKVSNEKVEVRGSFPRGCDLSVGFQKGSPWRYYREGRMFVVWFKSPEGGRQ